MLRIVLLTEGKSNPNDAKTATGLLRYRAREVVAVLDSTRAGSTAQALFGTGGEIPVVASLRDVQGDTLLIGIAPAGGQLPAPWRKVLREAIRLKMSIVSGLHFFLNDDPEISRLARKAGVTLHDVRKPPATLTVSRDVARTLDCHRVHTVGHDCTVGKMVASIELARALRERGRDAAFVATGQTGIMVSGRGVPVDRVISDFVAGAIEEEVIAQRRRELLLIEGQGSLVHPLYSGVTLSLLHGCAPQTMVMVFDPTRKRIKHTSHSMPPLEEIIHLYEEMASLMVPSRVVAIAANTYALSSSAADRAVKRTEDRLGLPTADVIRHGPDRIVDAILKRHAKLGLGPPAARRQAARGGPVRPVRKA